MRVTALASFSLLLLATSCSLHRPATLRMNVAVPGRPPTRVGFESLGRRAWLAAYPPARASLSAGCYFVNVLTADQAAFNDAHGGKCWIANEVSRPVKNSSGDSFTIPVEITPGKGRTVQVLKLVDNGAADPCTGSVADRLRDGAQVLRYGETVADLYAGATVEVMGSANGSSLLHADCSSGSSPPGTNAVLYVADELNYRIRSITTSGVATVFGSGNYYSSGPSTPAADGLPAAGNPIGYVTALTQDSAGNIYFAEASQKAIRKIKKSDGTLQTIGTVPGTPGALVTDDTYLYVVDTIYNCVVRFGVTPGAYTPWVGSCAVSPATFIDNCSPGVSCGLTGPSGIALKNDMLYITNSGRGEIVTYNMTTFTGNVLAGLGVPSSPLTDATGGTSLTVVPLGNPYALAFGPNGTLYFTDVGTGMRSVRKITFGSPNELITIAGDGNAGLAGGNVASSQTDNPKGIAVAADGMIYFSEFSQPEIRNIDDSSAFAYTDLVTGNATFGFDGESGTVSGARFANPLGLAFITP